MNLRKQGALLIALLISAVDLAQHPAQNEQCAQKWALIHIVKNMRTETGVRDLVARYEGGTAKILYNPSVFHPYGIHPTDHYVHQGEGFCVPYHGSDLFKPRMI